MTFSVIVEQANGGFVATLAGESSVRVEAPSRDEALNALKQELSTRVKRGELVSLDVSPRGISELAGKYADDPTLEAICDEAYELRNRELAE